jgi:hypothetical protein
LAFGYTVEEAVDYAYYYANEYAIDHNEAISDLATNWHIEGDDTATIIPL